MAIHSPELLSTSLIRFNHLPTKPRNVVAWFDSPKNQADLAREDINISEESEDVYDYIPETIEGIGIIFTQPATRLPKRHLPACSFHGAISFIADKPSGDGTFMSWYLRCR